MCTRNLFGLIAVLICIFANSHYACAVVEPGATTQPSAEEEQQMYSAIGRIDLADGDPEVEEQQIQLLGKLRAVKAVPVLCKYLVLPPYHLQMMAESDFDTDEYPACAALKAIGPPCIDGLLDYIVHNDISGFYSVTACILITEIVGDEAAPAVLKTYRANHLLDEPGVKRFDDFASQFRDRSVAASPTTR